MKHVSAPRHHHPLVLTLLTLLLSLPFAPRAAAQTIPQYVFTDTTEAYAPLGTGATAFPINGGGGTVDDGISLPLPLPFAFPFAGAGRPSVVVSSNGWLAFDANPNPQVINNVLNQSQNLLVAFFGRDLDQRRARFSYRTDGAAPGRVFKVEGDSIAQYNPNGAPVAFGHVQVWLYETGRIELRYGRFDSTFTTPNLTTTQVGLRGTGPTDVLALTGTWPTPITSPSPAAALPLDDINFPVDNSVFRFDPPAGLDLTPPALGPITVTPPAPGCTPTAHTISVNPTDASGIAAVRLTYSVGSSAPVAVPLTNAGGTWSATIPAQGTALVTYTLTVTDASPQANQFTSAPATYADGTLTVDAGPDVTVNLGTAVALLATGDPRAAVKISEFTLSSIGIGATRPRPSYLGGADDFVEIANVGAREVNLSGYRFEVRGPGTNIPRAFTIPNGVTLPDSAVLVLHLGPGTDSPTNNFFHTGGTNDPLGSGADVGFLLLSPGGTPVDAVAVNNFAAATSFPPGVWQGAGVSSPFGIAGAGLHGPDLNTSVNWTLPDTAVTARQTIGAYNPGLSQQPLPRVIWTGGILAAPDTTNPLRTPAHPATGAFTYVASLTQNGCTVTDSVRVTVVTPVRPNADFRASATDVFTADAVQFTDLSTNLPTTWLWTFTPNTVQFLNGTSVASRNPRVRFVRAGCYTVALTASNPAGTDTEARLNFVCAKPSYCPGVTLQVAPCGPTNGQINSVSLAGTTLSSLNTGCANTSGNAYTVFPVGGATTATLVAGQTYALTVESSSTGAVGAWLDANTSGVFDPNEFISVTTGTAGPAPVATTVMFTVPAATPNGVAGLRIRNSITPNSITAANSCTQRPSGETEDYYVTITANCTLTAPVLSNPGPVCVGSTLRLAIAAQPLGTTYAWTGPNGYASTDPEVVIPNATAAAAGVYTLVISRNGCSSAPRTTTVVVNPVPTAPAAISVSRCGPGVVRLAYTNIPAGTAYRWYTTATGGTAIPNANAGYTTPSLTVTTTYYVSTVMGGCESPIRAAATAVINPAPTVTLAASGPTTFCAGASVTLTATGGGPGATFTFRRNNFVVPGSVGNTLVATLAGSYVVTATDPSTCFAVSAPVVLAVTPVPSAAFAYPTGTFCQTATTNPRPAITGTMGGTFSATPAGLTISATTGQLTLGSSTPGTYVVAYTVAGSCPVRQTQLVTISTAPVAGFVYPATAACAGSPDTLRPVFSAGASAGYVTTTPTGLRLLPTSGGIVLALSTPGTYTITNTIAASATCPTVSATATLTVAARPTSVITAGGPTTLCAGDSVTLTASGGTSYVWSTGATTPAITVDTAGLYTVTATNAAGCAVTSAPVSVVVNPRLSAAFTYSVVTYCTGLGTGTTGPATITGAAGGLFTATPAGLSLNPVTGEIDLTASAPGGYTVTYALGAPCPASATELLNLTASPLASFTYATPSGCAGTPGTLALTLAPGAAVGVLTALPATGLSLDPATGTITLATSQGGTYVVQNVVDGGSGCASDTSTATVTINPLPVLAFPNLQATYCTADPTVQLTGTVDGVAGLGITTLDGALASQFTPGALGVGTYTVGLSGSTGAGCSASLTQTVTIVASPSTPTVTAALQPSGVVLLTSSAPTGNQWFFNGTAIAGATDVMYSVGSAAQSGFYSVTSTVGSCASAPSAPQSVSVTGLTAATAASAGFQLFPNPTADGQVQVQVTLTGAANPQALPGQLTVLDALGRVVFRAALPANSTIHALDLRALPPGVYSVRVLTAAGPVVRRLVRE